jgi:hypothetical protein
MKSLGLFRHKLLRFATAKLGLLVLCCVWLAQAAIAEEMNENDLKAAFVYRFAQYAGWSGRDTSELHLCVSSSEAQFAALEKLRERKINGNPIQVMRLSAVKHVNDCHVLYIGAQGLNEKNVVLSQYAQAQLLLISDLPYALEEKAIIALVTEPNHISFKVNLSEAKKQGLYLSSQMLKLAKEVR